ncbi:MAG: hypothetical protein ACTS22_03780 [Phycisphaerales bacterium]
MSGAMGQTSDEPSKTAVRIDTLMERASEALGATAYFETVTLCDRALRLAIAARDWERVARICLPLQEARRQIRQLATDAGVVRLVDTPTQLRMQPSPGCYLVQPPLVGADARGLRAAAAKRCVPVFVLTREPLTRAGLWPVVGVSSITVRERVPPPPGVEPDSSSPTLDRSAEPVPLSWFEAAAESLGDAAIASVDPVAPAAHRVEDLLERIEALPEHEKLHQRLADAARQAMHEPVPRFPRRRGVDHPFSF